MNAEEKLSKIKQIVLLWDSKEGHDRCWYYPELFKEIAQVLEIELNKSPQLPTLEEFKEGCCKYQKEQFTNV